MVLKQSDTFLLKGKDSMQRRKGSLDSIKDSLQEFKLTNSPPSPRIDISVHIFNLIQQTVLISAITRINSIHVYF